MDPRMPDSITDGRQFEDPEICSLHGCEMDGEFCPECDEDNYEWEKSVMELIPAEIERDSTMHQRNRLCRSRWLYRRAEFLDGIIRPDLRDQELRARGRNLDMRLFVLRIERRRQAQ